MAVKIDVDEVIFMNLFENFRQEWEERTNRLCVCAHLGHHEPASNGLRDAATAIIATCTVQRDVATEQRTEKER